MRVAAEDGGPLAVHDLGGTGRPLLACHGAGFHGRVWAPLAALLGDRFRCWAPDLRGHGDSPAPAGWTFAWTGFAADVLGAVAGLGLDRPVGLGHSMGATALLLAEQAVPGTFSALYLYEPILLPGDPGQPVEDHPLVGAALRRQAVFASRHEAYETFAAKAPLDALDPAALRAYVEHGLADLPDGTVGLKCRGVDEAQIYRMGRSHRAFEHLGEVACPTVVAVGGRSGSARTVPADLVVSRLPAGGLERFEVLGHLGPMQDPVVVAGAVASACS